MQKLIPIIALSAHPYTASIAPARARPRQTRNVIDKVLHPDQKGNVTEADIDEACKAWNAC
jgi:hypothetical protein